MDRVAPARNGVVEIYTDGGCEPNPGIGGWGAVLLYNEHRKELSGGERKSTNNRMELTAAISALEALKRPSQIRLFTDSEYLMKGITEWMPGWKKRNWKRKGGELVNVDLWRRLDALNERHDISWRWVRGHTGVAENERCDELAAAEIRKIRRSHR